MDLGPAAWEGSLAMDLDIDPIEDLGAAIDWYAEVVGSAAHPVSRRRDRAAAEREIEAVERRISPYRLPAELRWFWETWDPSGFDVLPTPQLGRIQDALSGWNVVAWDDESPRALLPIGYAGHEHLLIDLTGSAGTPAAVWSYAFGGDLVCEAPSLAALIRACAERAEGALLDPSAAAGIEADRYGFYLDVFDGPELRAIVDRHFAASAEARRRLPLDAGTWPARWVEAQRTMTGGSQSRGRTHTVAELVPLLATGSVRARLRGTMTPTGGLEMGEHDLMTFEDETGSIDLALPTSAWPPGWRPGDEVEVEVVGRGPLPPRPRAPEPDPAKVRDVEARYGSWIAYLVSAEGRTDPEIESAAAHLRTALGAYKPSVPLVERADLISR